MCLDVPSAPKNLEANEVTQTSAVLRWSVPDSDGGSPITNYVVEKCTNFNSRWVRATRTNITDTTVSLDDLVEGTNYEFRVCAENEAGSGPFCQPIGPVEAKAPQGNSSFTLHVCYFYKDLVFTCTCNAL